MTKMHLWPSCIQLIIVIGKNILTLAGFNEFEELYYMYHNIHFTSNWVDSTLKQATNIWLGKLIVMKTGSGNKCW